MLLGFFIYLVLSPFLPKERGDTPVVIHNNIHITNTPEYHNDYSAQSQSEPEQRTSEEGLFRGIRL
jgi:hypothetical protein